MISSKGFRETAGVFVFLLGAISPMLVRSRVFPLVLTFRVVYLRAGFLGLSFLISLDFSEMTTDFLARVGYTTMSISGLFLISSSRFSVDLYKV